MTLNYILINFMYMKKITLLLVMLFVATFGSIAQNYQEVVHLKDGSIIKGLITEQRPNDYLKIRTSSGKVYTLKMYEVDKITKERITERQSQRKQITSRQSQTSSRSSSTYRQDHNEYYSYFPSKGYKGFIDLGFSLGLDDDWDYNDNKFEFTTSHGYIFNPHLFVGLGIGLNYYVGHYDDDYYQYDDEDRIEVPIFAHIRTHFLDRRVTPFADAKLGYIVTGEDGVYFSPSVGCRFARSNRSAFWVSLGFSVIRYDDSRVRYRRNSDRESLTMRVGWDF